MKRFVVLVLVLVGALALSGRSDAATADTAAASADLPAANVGDVVTLTSTNPCTIACSLTWRRPDLGIARFGGMVVGEGEQITLSFDAPGNYEVVLDLGETCVGTSRLVCHSYAFVFISVTDPAVDPAAPPPADVPPADVPPADVPPADVPPADVPPADVPPADVPPADVPPAAVPPVDVPPVDVPPVDAPPVDAPPAGVPPADVPPADVPPVDVPPVVEVVVPAGPPLVAPDDLTVTVVRGRTRLTWTNPDSSATSLVLERCFGWGCTSFTPVVELTTSTASFIESRIRNGFSTATYRLAASDATGTVYSNLVTASIRR